MSISLSNPGGGGGGGGGGLVADAINDGTTTVAPSQNAVFDALALKAPLASPALTGTPTAPTATAGTNTTQVATTAFVVARAIPVTATSTTNAAKTSDATPAAHAQLKVECAANGLYLIRAVIHYGGASTVDTSVGLSGPSGAATVGGLSVLAMPAGLGTSPETPYTGTGTTTVGLGQVVTIGNPGNSGGTDRRQHAVLEAVVQMSSTAGDISVIWAQGTSNVTASTVFTGSTLTVTKIG